MENIFSFEELEEQVGENLKQLRLHKNIDRKTLCERAGVSLNALRHLEAGHGTLKTLIRVVRALDRQEWLLGIAPTASINPLHRVRGQSVRQRASRRSHDL